jgi:hypothetical protein
VTTSNSALAPLAAYSVFDTIGAIYRFLITKWLQVLAAIAVPVLLAFVVLLFTLHYYFSTLATYLTSHDVHIASHAISATVVGLLLWLVLNAIACGRLIRLVGGEAPSGWFDIRPLALEATINAAVLRYLLVIVAACALAVELATAAARLAPGIDANMIALVCGGGLAVFVAIFVVRCGFLLPALAYYGRRKILRRGWELSRVRFWRFAAVLGIAVLLPSLVVQTVGDLVTEAFIGRLGEVAAKGLAGAASMLAADGSAILAIALSLTVSSGLCLTLWTIASGLTFQGLSHAS